MTDGRSATARRFKDLVEDISADLGGKELLSEGQRQLIRRAAMLSAECERLEALAARGECPELTAPELATFTELTGRTQAPGEAVEELWLIAGRRSGKTRAIGTLAAYLAACVDYRPVLGPGERGVLPVLAGSVQRKRR
jgi:hypothetical protein